MVCRRHGEWTAIMPHSQHDMIGDNPYSLSAYYTVPTYVTYTVHHSNTCTYIAPSSSTVHVHVASAAFHPP